MKSFSSPEQDGPDRDIIRLLKKLGTLEPEYPPELMESRRAAFLAQADEQGAANAEEELSPADQEVVRLLGYLKTTPVNYPPDMLAARRAALLQQVGTAKPSSLWDELRGSIRRNFQNRTAMPGLRTPLVIASFLAAALIAALFLSRMGQSSRSAESAGVVALTRPLSTGSYEVALVICKPDEQTPLCPPGGLNPGPDLADQGNGAARPAVSKDARSGQAGAHRAAYVNDGRAGGSWVSNSADSWIKIDLGRVTTINTVSLQKGIVDSSDDNNPGQFVISVALSDVYADGNSSNDYTEYAQVFRSDQAGFSGRVSPTETIRTRFPPVEARFVKITFEQAGAAIEEVGVFLEEPPLPVEQPTQRPTEDAPESTLTASPTGTVLSLATATALPTNTRTPTETAVSVPTETPSAAETPVLLPTNAPTLRPTNTRSPANTPTTIPTDPLPSNTPIPSPTAIRPTVAPPTAVPPTAVPPTAVPPTAIRPTSAPPTAVPPTAVPPTLIPPTAIPPTVQPPPVDTDPIVVTGNDQTQTFTCNGNDAFIRGHANTVTLLGSCRSITVTGNGNRVFWEAGSPEITNRGNDNVISQR
ncbi:MAG TPA: discoidin domain-containing protein [Anaerolineales bacterium]|nr:discoidin domain-containing protein [Anaerolineales bacterium]